MGWLDGQVTLVVGGGSGIGRGVVEGFIGEGAQVGVMEIDPEKVASLRELGPSVSVTQGNATLFEDNERAVAETIGSFGRLDNLVCCVGVTDHHSALQDLPEDVIGDAFDELFTINVKSYLLSARAALRELLRTEGSMILTVSNAGFYPAGGGPLYVASKFAVRGLVVELAYELAPKVRVNGVAPGGTIGSELRGLEALGQEVKIVSEMPNRKERIQSNTPLQVVCEPEDHVGAYVYLASRTHARVVTGTVINSDGGIGVRGIAKLAGLL